MGLQVDNKPSVEKKSNTAKNFFSNASVKLDKYHGIDSKWFLNKLNNEKKVLELTVKHPS